MGYDEIVKSAEGVIPEEDKSLMSLLLNYALLYCAGKFYDKSCLEFSTYGCSEFEPFCSESTPGPFSYQNLSNLLHEFRDSKDEIILTIEKEKEKIVATEEKLIKQSENTIEKEVVGMIQIKYDLEKLKSLMEEGKESIDIEIIINDIEQIDKEAENIDLIIAPEKKLAKVRDLKNHANLKSLIEINRFIADEV
jgi:hypothetical protein